MAGTKEGGVKASITNKEKYGEDFYGRIGIKGGKASKTGGFYVNRELARSAGAKGGKISKRGKRQQFECGICGAYPMTAKCNNARCDDGQF